MESVTGDTPLVVILGQTASGKSALALKLAKKYNGEIIAADSRTIYRGMNIGTAKPTPLEMTEVPHHIIDVVDPDQIFTAADFQRLANEAIEDIASRGKLPIMVGGTGLYIDAVIYGFSFRAAADPIYRKELEALSVTELQAQLLTKGIVLPQNDRNPRHLIRALETGMSTGGRMPLRPNTLVIGLAIDKEVLEQKIRARVETMIAHGLVDEVKSLVGRYGWDLPALQTPAYRAFHPYFDGLTSLAEAKQAFIQNDLRYAKRQKTWFKRNTDIHWISKTEESVDLITTLLNK